MWFFESHSRTTGGEKPRGDWETVKAEATGTVEGRSSKT